MSSLLIRKLINQGIFFLEYSRGSKVLTKIEVMGKDTGSGEARPRFQKAIGIQMFLCDGSLSLTLLKIT